ncbi:MAG: response regulator transcription factor [Chthoniobacterales bacterium]
METLPQKDWLRLHDVIADLHSVDQFSEIPARVLEGLRWAVPCDTASVQDDRGGAKNIPWTQCEKILWQPSDNHPRLSRGVRTMPPWMPNYLPLREAWLALSDERHPHTDYYRRTGDGAARRLSDILPSRQLRRTGFYNELSRPLGLNWQLTIYLRLPPMNTLVLAACRRGLDFSDRDCAMLELLRPHVEIAWRRALQNERRNFLHARPPGSQPSSDSTGLQALGITKREADVLLWIAEGKTNPEVCLILGMSPSTVKTHVARLLAKLDCVNRTALARVAIESS